MTEGRPKVKAVRGSGSYMKGFHAGFKAARSLYRTRAGSECVQCGEVHLCDEVFNGQ